MGMHPTFQYISPLIGIGFLIPSWRAWRKYPPVPGRLALLDGLVALIFFTLMPPQTAQTVDQVCHCVGLGRLLVDVFGTLAVAVQFAYICAINETWSWWRTGTLVIYGMLMLLVVAWWKTLPHVGGPAVAGLYYHGNAGRPLAALLMNATSGLCTLYIAGLVTSQFLWRSTRAHGVKERLLTSGSIVVFAGVMVHGASTAVEASARARGADPTRALMFTGPTSGLTLLVALAVPWVSGIMYPLAHRFKLHHLLQGLQDAVILIADLLNQLFGDPDVLAAVDERCREQGLPDYWRRVALLATRLITASRANRMRAVAEQADGLTARVQAQPALTGIGRWYIEEARYIVDAVTVALLAAPHIRPPEVKQPHEPKGSMRRRLATLIAAELYTYNQAEPARAGFSYMIEGSRVEMDAAAATEDRSG